MTENIRDVLVGIVVGIQGLIIIYLISRVNTLEQVVRTLVKLAKKQITDKLNSGTRHTTEEWRVRNDPDPNPNRRTE